MKKILLITAIIFTCTHTQAEAFTRADIDLLVSIDVIENTSFIPLLYLLAEDTPTPTTAEIIAAVEASKQPTSKPDADANDENKDTTTATKSEVLQNLQTNAYIEKNNTVANEETGIYTFSFDVTAGGNDIWIEDTVSDTTGGFVYRINSETTFTGSQTAFISKTSASDKDNDAYKISEGSTESFEITIELNPDELAENDIYEIQMRSVTFANNSAGNNAYTFTLSDKSKFKTGKLLIE